MPGSGHYAAAKAGVNSLTKTLSLEFAPTIRVNGISPGYVPTEVMMTALNTDEEQLEQLAEKRIPLKRLGTPDDMGSTARLPRERCRELDEWPDPDRRRRPVSDGRATADGLE